MKKGAPGQRFEFPFQFSQSDVNDFIRTSGDDNPIHHDEQYAAGTIFKKPIIHGMLSASVFSRMFATTFPGQGTIYLSQNLQFKRPMYVDEPYTAIIEVEEVNEEKHTGKISTTVIDANGKETIKGEAVLMHREVF
jgi:acyl dehydratase